jgi:hypothetical protein
VFLCALRVNQKEQYKKKRRVALLGLQNIRNSA